MLIEALLPGLLLSLLQNGGKEEGERNRFYYSAIGLISANRHQQVASASKGVLQFAFCLSVDTTTAVSAAFEGRLVDFGIIYLAQVPVFVCPRGPVLVC